MKKTLMKSLLLAVFALATQSVCAQGVVANIQPNMSEGQKFFFDEILYEITSASGSQYDVKAIGFYCEGSAFADAVIEIIGNGEANGASFTVTEIEALNAVYKMQGSDYVAGSASLADIELIKFVNKDNNGFAGTIGADAFANLSGLTDVETALTTPPTADATSFKAIKSAKLTVPDDEKGQGGIAGLYAKADGWKVFAKMYVEGATGYAFGDVNCDNRINNRDVTALRSYIGAPSAYTGNLNQKSLDASGDGRLNNRDVTALRSYVGTR